MQINLSMTTELWDLQKPIVPAQSRLFHLEPIGVGTLFVESLMSYIARLAQWHCVTPRQLILKEIAPQMIHKGYPATRWFNTIQRLFSSCSPLIKGNEVAGIMAISLIQALEELTLRQDLSRLSLLRQVSSLLEGSQLRKHLAWCPICLEEWRQAKRAIYLPLIWLVQDLNICPQHREQPLRQHCLHCQQLFPPLTGCSRPGFCSKCHSWLGNIPAKQKHQQLDPKGMEWDLFFPDPLTWQLFWIDDLEELLTKTEQPFYPPKLNY